MAKRAAKKKKSEDECVFLKVKLTKENRKLIKIAAAVTGMAICDFMREAVVTYAMKMVEADRKGISLLD
jgi:uncharacterized protein (DUF1778 family)